jgi:MFS family permease
MGERALSGRKPSSQAVGANLAMAGVILVIFLYAIDATIVSTAMPMVVANVGGLELYSWVFSIYMLASALAMPLHSRP